MKSVTTNTPDALIRKLAESDFENLISLARAIWVAYYVPLLGSAQVDYMLAMRFTPENLRRYLDASDRWLEILWLAGDMVGYCSYALTATPAELKLEQLYLLPGMHGRGLGGKMLRHVEERARDLGCRVLVLQVNKHNLSSIAIYRKFGFTVREEAVFDIGQGYVMDDYVMEKQERPS